MNQRFTIIIPVYNLEKYICQCLDSVLNQNYLLWEAIIVNDGSIDNSLDILKKYSAKDTRFRVLDKQNEGLSAARNDAMKLAKGDYIIFLDGDDWLELNTLQIIHDQIGTENIDLFVHRMKYYYSENNCKANESKIIEQKYNGIDFLHTVLNYKEYNFFVAPAKAYKRTFLENNSIVFLNGILHEDGPFFYKVCSKAQSVLFCKKAMYFYRQQREGQITSTRTYKTYFGIISGIKQNIEIFGLADKVINGSMLNLMTFLAGNYKTEKDKKLVFKELRKWSNKKLILYLLFHSKSTVFLWIRGSLLFIDPNLLNFIYKVVF